MISTDALRHQKGSLDETSTEAVGLNTCFSERFQTTVAVWMLQ